MSGRWRNHYAFHIRCKNKRGVKRTVKDECKFMLGMTQNDAFHALKGKVANALHFALDQHPGIYGNLHQAPNVGNVEITAEFRLRKGSFLP